jgi:phage terminase large subunit-like protein
MELIEGQLQALPKSQWHRVRIGVGAPTNVQVRDVCIEGDTGIQTLFGSEFTKYNKSIGQIELIHKSGARIRAMGMEQARMWNGPQWSGLWIDEFPLCNPIAIRDAVLALRLGPKAPTHPFRARTILTFTPKSLPWINEYLAREDVYVPMLIDPDTGELRFPTTYDNPYLPEHMFNFWRQQYEGTRIGLRELHGIEIAGVEGAMWGPEMFVYEPDPDKWPEFIRVVVAIDPAGTSARKTADENAVTAYEKEHEEVRRAKTAICVLGLGIDGKIYVLFWVAGRWSPNTWARKAVDLYHLSGASLFVAERNFGGDMVEATLRNVWNEAPIDIVVASKGKDQRAEPVVTLYEQKRVVHCAVFPDGEGQCCAFKSAKENEGADYVDSLVWGVYKLMGWKVADPYGIGPVKPIGPTPTQGIPMIGTGEAQELGFFVVGAGR